jgi:hypothetical protein
MGPFAMVAVALQIIFWFSLLAVAAVFVAALIRGAFEAISDHKRILDARIAQGFLSPSPQWERATRARHLPSH